jgi:pimeloyl-ACP methyl ester carboxylesterase
MFVTSGEVKLFYDVLGSGPDLVLLHAFPVNHEIWLPVAERLARQYRVVVFDLRGHADSGVGSGPATMDLHVGDVLRICDAVGVRQACFAGVSIGGYILFELWRRAADRIRALILSDTRAQSDSDEARATRLRAAADVERNGPAAFLDSMVPKLLGATTISKRAEVVAAVRRMIDKMTAAGIAAVQRGMAARPDSRPTLASIHVPTLVLVGAEDTVTTPADADIIQKGIAGSSSAVLPAAGHLAVYEQPDAATEVTTRFLDSAKVG